MYSFSDFYWVWDCRGSHRFWRNSREVWYSLHNWLWSLLFIFRVLLYSSPCFWSLSWYRSRIRGHRLCYRLMLGAMYLSRERRPLRSCLKYCRLHLVDSGYRLFYCFIRFHRQEGHRWYYRYLDCYFEMIRWETDYYLDLHIMVLMMQTFMNVQGSQRLLQARSMLLQRKILLMIEQFTIGISCDVF